MSPKEPDASPGGETLAEETAERASAKGASAAPKRRGWMRRLYDWVLHWAETPYGPAALFALALAESSFFPVPPDPLLIALCLGATRRSFRFAASATVASVIGGMIGYAVGAGAWQLVGDWFFSYVPGVTPAAFARVQAMYDRWDFWAIFLAGLTPIPYKVFTLSAGVFGIDLPIFVLASVLSRGLRFFVVGALIHRYGAPIARFIDRYFDLLAVVFGMLLVGGFIVIKILL